MIINKKIPVARDGVFKKKKGKNHDLTIAEYKVAKEEEKIEKLSTDKIGLEADILVLSHRKSTKQKKLDELDGEIESSNIFLKSTPTDKTVYTVISSLCAAD